MAVVHLNSDLYRDYQAGDPVIDPLLIKGRPVIATGTLTNAGTDSAASTWRIADLPSDCLLHPDTSFDVAGWGFAQTQIGTKADATALVDQTRATEAIVTPIAFGDANHGKRLWDVLGLAEDPGGFITLYAHAAAGATGAGTMPFQITTIQN